VALQHYSFLSSATEDEWSAPLPGQFTHRVIPPVPI
jgi:hypothetical protein